MAFKYKVFEPTLLRNSTGQKREDRIARLHVAFLSKYFEHSPMIAQLIATKRETNPA
jgi:hypothetical protein